MRNSSQYSRTDKRKFHRTDPRQRVAPTRDSAVAPTDSAPRTDGDSTLAPTSVRTL